MAQYINKFILTGVLGQRNEILYVDCKGERGGKNYLPDTRQSQSPWSIACFFHTPNPHRRFSSAGVSMHASGAPSLKMYSFIQSPSEKSQCLVVLFFLGCPDGICVNNISLVRQKISTGYHSRGD